MKTPESLKSELFEKLKQCPTIEAFFKESLQKRVGLDDTWIENPLVVYILDEEFKKESTLSGWIETLAGSPPDYDHVRKKLAGNHSYDQKMHDVLAEVRAYCDIRISGFTEIKAIPENIQKAPDFSAVLNETRYLFEVKNMRSPTDVQDFLRDKITARRLENPKDYENLEFHIRVARAWEEISFTSATAACMKSKLLNWLQDFFRAIESGEKLGALSRKRFVAGQKDELWVECDLKEGSHSIMSRFSRGQELDVVRRNELPPFLRKAVGKIDKGASQLFEYDDADQYQKYVLLSFELQEYFGLMKDELHAIIRGLDSIVKNINDKLHVKWVGRDNLP
ncbi:MAG: hypothetical protein AMJ73_09395 [candidate division Zixibacteria bacterium SM1_73]|nr:MAG: hypothetical protein AMJ73_09395 [candidate division Zixibacteria bacterium SM1_73]